MNAPFLTGGQSPSHPGLINEINTDVSVLTPPSSIIVPSSIESSPQGLSIKPDPVSQTCLVQGAQMLQPQQQQPGSFPILRCVSCGNMDCMVPAEPNEDLPYGLHYRVGGHIPSPQHQHEQWPQTQPWGFNASETLPDQASMHFEAASAFPNLDVQQHGGLVKDFGFGSEPFPLASSGVSLTLPVSLAPGTPESVGMLHQQQPHMQEQTQVEAEVQAAQRKRLPEIPDQPQLSEYTSEDSEMASEDDSDHESDISSFDESYDDQTVHISNTKTNQRLGDVAAGSFSPLSSATDTATRNPITAAGTQIALDAPSNKEGRRAKDDFLLKCRARGMTYREIKEAGNLQEAESTLRGRHRVLTKNKSERIRKPSWTQDDVSFLRTKLPYPPLHNPTLCSFEPCPFYSLNSDADLRQIGI